MKRIPVLIVAGLFLLLGSAAGDPAAQRATASPEFPPGDLVIFVGNHVVDLKWPPVAGANSYTVYKDGHVIFGPGQPETEPLTGDLFYRDSGVLKDEMLQYQVCADVGGEDDCSAIADVEVGLIKGTLYKDLTWQDGFYDLDGVVQLVEGVTLTIEDGATVGQTAAPTGTPSIRTGEGPSLGKLVVQGGAGAPPFFEDVELWLYSNGNSIRGSEGSLITLKGVRLVLRGDTPVEYCHFRDFSSVGVRATHGVPALRHNLLWHTMLHVRGASAQPIELSNNSFRVCSECIYLREGASAEIRDNSFEPSVSTQAIDIGASDAMITGNRFEKDWDPSYHHVQVWPNSGGTVTIAGNEFYSAADERSGVAIGLVRAIPGHSEVEPPPETGEAPQVTINGDNVIQYMHAGIKVSGNVDAQIQSNSLTRNRYAVIVENSNDLALNGNCIALNDFAGLHVDGSNVDATGNWWGSSEGPSSSGDPGHGDLVIVESGSVNLGGSLTEDNCHRLARNLSVAAMEVPQVVQNPLQPVKMIEGKPGVVRAYPCSDSGELPGVTGALLGRRGDEFLGTLRPERSITARYTLDHCSNVLQSTLDQMRADRDGGLLFKLPQNWMSGTVTLTVELNDTRTIEERDYEDNVATVEATLHRAPPVRVGVVGVTPPDHDAVILDAFLEMGNLLRKVYPSRKVESSILPAIDWPYELEWPPGSPFPGLPKEKHGAMLLNVLGLSQMRLRAEGAWVGGAVDQLFGAVSTEAITHWKAEPVFEGGRGRAAYAPGLQQHLANAVGWNLRGPQTTYPCSHETLEYGYDVGADRVMPPDSYNVMCIGSDAPADPNEYWVGIEAYEAWLDFQAQTTAMPRSLPSSPVEDTYLVLAGVVSDGGEALFMPTWRLVTSEVPQNPPAGSGYCVELRDAGEAVLASHCFDFLNPYSWWDGFLVALPLTGDPARVVLLQGSAELAEILVSEYPPVVTFQSATRAGPASDSLSLSWSAADDDGDALHYSILYSADNGATWLPAVTNLETNGYTLDLGRVPGGTQARIRVEASDGYHVTSDEWGPFAVGDHAPWVSILHPESRSVVSPTLTLSGSGYDLEDGQLEDAALVWTSSLDGLLGTGPILFVNDLTPGTHWLTLTATDSAAQATSSSILIGVGQSIDYEYAIYVPLVLR
jgi:hypothetical protein